MEIDKTTQLKEINIVIDDTPEHLKMMRKQANEDDQNSNTDVKKISLTTDEHRCITDEIYLEDGCLYFGGNLISEKGNAWVSFKLPLSQEILFDILGESIKKFNKVKTVLEATK